MRSKNVYFRIDELFVETSQTYANDATVPDFQALQRKFLAN